MNKIKVEKFYDGRDIEVKGGELNFEMEYDLKKVLGLVVESEIEEFKRSDMDYIEYYNSLNCVNCYNVEDVVNDIIESYKMCGDIEDIKGEFVLSEEGFCRIYKDGVLVVE
jgi:hypothetical protein